MDQDQAQAPAFWATELGRSDDDIACGRTVAAHVVHDRLRTLLARLEADLAVEADGAAPLPPDR